MCYKSIECYHEEEMKNTDIKWSLFQILKQFRTAFSFKSLLPLLHNFQKKIKSNKDPECTQPPVGSCGVIQVLLLI